MPIVQNNQMQNGAGAPQPYGVQTVENTIPFQERLLRLFKPQEYVRIKNIDEAPVYWQYLPSDNEDIQNTVDGMQKIVTRGKPEMWFIEPGAEEVLVGANAYMALDVMYKNVTAKKTLKQNGITASFDKEGAHLPKNFNFADGGTQDIFIKQAYLGKATPTFGNVQAEPAPETTQPIDSKAVQNAKELVGAKED